MKPERQRLSPEALAQALATRPDWEMTNDGAAIVKRFTFSGFSTAFGFMAEVALVAERLDHHPDWSNSWNRVTVSLTTHDRDGVTGFDLALADACDRAAAGRTKSAP